MKIMQPMPTVKIKTIQAHALYERVRQENLRAQMKFNALDKKEKYLNKHVKRIYDNRLAKSAVIILQLGKKKTRKTI